MNSTRTKHSFYNFLVSVIPTILIMGMGFIKIKYFIEYYGSELNGVSSYFTQVISYLSLVEGGFTTAFVQSLYSPLSKKDKNKVTELFYGAHNVLSVISIIMFVISILVFIFLPSSVKNMFSLTKLLLIYAALVLPNILNYYIYAPTFVITADQKEYKINVYKQSILVIRLLLQVVFILMGLDFVFIVLIDGLAVILPTIIARRVVYKEYPYLRSYKQFKPDYSNVDNTKYLFVHKMAWVVKTSTDNLALVVFFPDERGLVLASIYNSYNYIITSLRTIFTNIINAPKNSFGNLFTEEGGRGKEVFEELMDFTLYLSGIVLITLFITFNNFILEWLEIETYVQSKLTVFLFCYMLFESLARTPIHIVRDVNGLFKDSKNYALFEAMLKVFLSVILVIPMQITGLLLGGAVSSIFIGFFFNAKLVYNKIFDESVLNFIKFISPKILIMFIVGLVGDRIWTRFVTIDGVVSWFINAGVLFIVVSLAMLGLYYLLFTPFRKFIFRIKSLLIRK